MNTLTKLWNNIKQYNIGITGDQMAKRMILEQKKSLEVQ